MKDSGCSAVRLAHLLWEQGVPGSNPGIPTNENQGVTANVTPFLYVFRHIIKRERYIC